MNYENLEAVIVSALPITVEIDARSDRGGLHGTLVYAFALSYQELIAAGQADGEHGFAVIGSHGHFSPVRLGNLAYDI